MDSFVHRSGFGAEARRASVGLLALGIALCVLTPAQSSRAAPRRTPPRPAVKARTIVLLALRDRPELSKRAVQAVRSQLSDTQAVLRVVWVNRLAPKHVDQLALSRAHAAYKGVLAVVWYDVIKPDKVLILVAKSGRLVVRRVTGDAVGGRLEASAIIVRTSALVLLAGQPLPSHPLGSLDPSLLPRPRARPSPRPRRLAARPRPRPRPKPLPKPRPRHGSKWRFGLGLEASYALAGYSSDVGAAHGGSFGAAFHLGQGLSILLHYRVTQKVTGELGTSRLGLQPHPLSLGLRWRHRWGRFELGASAAVVMDYVTYDASVDPQTHGVSDSSGDLLWSLLPMLSSAVSVARRIRITLDAGAQIGLGWRRYVLDDGSQKRTILGPWPVHPILLVGLSADLI
ncbi:MAG: hypothetical protein ABI333_30985 [bacterium]